MFWSSVYSCHLFLISSAYVRAIPFLSFIVSNFAWKFPLVSLIFLKGSLVFPVLLFSSISLHQSVRKTFLSLLAIPANLKASRWLSRRMCAHLLCKNSKITTCCWKTIDRRILIPPKKRYPISMAKEKPQQDGRRGEFTFRIKPHTLHRCSEGSNKPCVHHDPETPQRLSQNCVWMSSVEV